MAFAKKKSKAQDTAADLRGWGRGCKEPEIQLRRHNEAKMSCKPPNNSPIWTANIRWVQRRRSSFVGGMTSHNGL